VRCVWLLSVDSVLLLSRAATLDNLFSPRAGTEIPYISPTAQYAIFPYVPLQLLYFPNKYCILVGRYTGLYNKSGHFLRIRQWGGGGNLQKGTILYRVGRNGRWFVGNKNFGVVSHLIVGGGGLGVFFPRKFLYFSIPMTAIPCTF
jgi:hypothetical protein